MIYTKEKFKELWEANSCGSGITYGDIADCAKAWGISEHPIIRPIDEITYKVLKAAQVNGAEEYNPNPAPMKREEIGCDYCIHEEVCEQRKHRTIPTRQLARECGNFVHYQAKKAFEQGVKWADAHPADETIKRIVTLYKEWYTTESQTSIVDYVKKHWEDEL